MTLLDSTRSDRFNRPESDPFEQQDAAQTRGSNVRTILQTRTQTCPPFCKILAFENFEKNSGPPRSLEKELFWKNWENVIVLRYFVHTFACVYQRIGENHWRRLLVQRDNLHAYSINVPLLVDDCELIDSFRPVERIRKDIIPPSKSYESRLTDFWNSFRRDIRIIGHRHDCNLLQHSVEIRLRGFSPRVEISTAEISQKSANNPTKRNYCTLRDIKCIIQIVVFRSIITNKRKTLHGKDSY